MTLRIRILAGFAAAFLACFVLGLISLHQTDRLNAVAARFGAELLPHVSVLADLRAEVNEHNRLLLRHVISTEPKEMAAIEGQLADENTLIDNFFAGAGTTFSAAQQRRLLDTARAAWEQYRGIAASVLDASRGGRKPDAGRIIAEAGQGAYQKFLDATNTMRQMIVLEAWTGVGETHSTYTFGLWLIAGALAVSAGISATGGILTVTHTCRPILALAQQMRQVAAREPDIEVVGRDRHDEIGIMAQALEQFRRDLRAADDAAARQQEEGHAKDHHTARLTELVTRFEHSVSGVLKTLTTAASQFDTTAHGMAGLAETTSRQALGSAEGARQASANVQTVAAAAEQLAASLSEIAQQVGRSSRMVTEATAEARATNANVTELTEAAARIGEVVQLISSIAGQTNLLALNATIEAARAGEAGRGFAVVAGEVKNLAGETARATDEITRQIAAIQGSTGRAVEAVRRITTSITAISEVGTGIAAAVEQQTAAVGEISRSAADAARHTGVVSERVAMVTAASAEAGTAAGQVLVAAGDLARQSASLHTEVSQFLDGIRAA
ncbi:HAMP domain-containing protein [Rhodovastum atsumiense]|uniref:HAMP domain-containing protein n=1 Tax=Rhodovastum atsumiense TaxID=504468 RepID=A0A5M6IWT7_9PROT|nr:methyl-accepting chemotaxis protein [Rhodovastum atsumiense]KAA5612701.1 HAMP domain-containing protein [Rhodovastum atsumiense]CAH2602748.1 HAMP domain-containing protein [Rhodovastum atsumiense]